MDSATYIVLILMKDYHITSHTQVDERHAKEPELLQRNVNHEETLNNLP